MRVKLPIPIFTETKVFTEIELVQPKALVLAEVERVTRDGNVFAGMQSLLNGSITAFYDANGESIEDSVSKKSMIMKMALKSAETIGIDALLLHDPDAGMVEGVYTCPRCGHRMVTGITEESDMSFDTRDSIQDLPIGYMESGSVRFTVDLEEPVRIKESSLKDGNSEIIEINSITMDHPTLKDCFSTFARYGIADPYRFQFGLFVEMIQGINGEAVDSKWKNKYGMMLFENIRNVKKDVGKITKEVDRYGRVRFFEKECLSCGRRWEAPVNTSRFFAQSPRTM